MFLSERREAHCEYFATATALLLRSQGIPCRLSVGYLVFEKSDETGDFVALNRNAHAWVEAYDLQSSSWSIVESTPTVPEYIRSHLTNELKSENVASATEAGLNSQRFDLYEFIRAVTSYVYSMWTTLLASRFAWMLPGALGAAYIAYRFAISSWRKSRGQVYQTSDARKADRLARKFGLERCSNETCLQFADRILKFRPELRELAVWYQDFSATRYRGEVSSPPPLPRLTGKPVPHA